MRGRATAPQRWLIFSRLGRSRSRSELKEANDTRTLVDVGPALGHTLDVIADNLCALAIHNRHLCGTRCGASTSCRGRRIKRRLTRAWNNNSNWERLATSRHIGVDSEQHYTLVGQCPILTRVDTIVNRRISQLHCIRRENGNAALVQPCIRLPRLREAEGLAKAYARTGHPPIWGKTIRKHTPSFLGVSSRNCWSNPNSRSRSPHLRVRCS